MECLRIDEIISNPDFAKYLITFTSGQTIFLEGDDSQDLYILVAGQVEIFKGDMKIREITEEGTVFGEVSFFLGDKRTASVKAKTKVEVICIPKEERSCSFWKNVQQRHRISSDIYHFGWMKPPKCYTA
jgi:signal-transduction protein with cAMP-binding, CBS, and nucleotidyltransferase domain